MHPTADFIFSFRFLLLQSFERLVEGAMKQTKETTCWSSCWCLHNFGLLISPYGINSNYIAHKSASNSAYIHHTTARFGGNMFDEGDNSPPWDFPLKNPLEQQNNTDPPSTESGAVKSYPLTEPARHKKEKGGHVAIYYGVGALMAACLAIFIMIAKD